MFCKSLIQDSRDIIRFNQPYSVIKSAGRKEGCFLFKNKGKGGELKAGENSRRVTGLCNESEVLETQEKAFMQYSPH